MSQKPKPEDEDESAVVLEQPGGETMLASSDPNAPPPAPPAGTLLGLPCEKCAALYPLPRGATSWRCRGCGHFNSTEPDQDFIICTIS
jgi:LSD1 subclass zinc finger protein